MRFLLDTNTCIGYLTGRSAGVSAKLTSTAPADIALCSIVKAELLYGARKSARVEHNLEQLAAFFAPLVCLPFDDGAAHEYGLIRADLEKSGRPIGPNDLMIAAIARSRRLTLVTGNRSEFDRVEGLAVESW